MALDNYTSALEKLALQFTVSSDDDKDESSSHHSASSEDTLAMNDNDIQFLNEKYNMINQWDVIDQLVKNSTNEIGERYTENTTTADSEQETKFKPQIEQPLEQREKPISPSKVSSKGNLIIFATIVLLAVSSTIIWLVLHANISFQLPWQSRSVTTYLPASSLSTINSKFRDLELKVTQLEFNNKNVHQSLEKVDSKVHALENTHKKFESDLNNHVSLVDSQLDRLRDIHNLPDYILDNIWKQLPQHLPIIVQSNGDIELTPELYNYLISLINENVPQQTWEEFVELNRDPIKDILVSNVQSLGIVDKQLLRSEIEESLRKSETSIDNKIQALKEDLIRQYLDTSRNSEPKLPDLDEKDPALLTSFQSLLNQVLSNSGPLNEHEMPKNFAEYSLGSSIIPKYTSKTFKQRQEKKRKHPIERALLGWLDFLYRNYKYTKSYLSDNENYTDGLGRVITSPANILKPGKNLYWETPIEPRASIGIRTPESFYLTGLLLSYPTQLADLELAIKEFTVYVKPYHAQDYERLFNALLLLYEQEPFIKGFVQIKKDTFMVKELPNDQDQEFEFPQLFVDLAIPIREIVLVVNSNWGDPLRTRIYPLQLFGFDEQHLKNAKKVLRLPANFPNTKLIERLREY